MNVIFGNIGKFEKVDYLKVEQVCQYMYFLCSFV